MLLLVSTTDKLQLIASAAANLDCVASLQDKTTSTGAVQSAVKRINTTGTTAIDIVDAPGSGIERNVVEFTVRNKHATQATDVTIMLDANGTDYELIKRTLIPGETLQYVEGFGFLPPLNEIALDRKLVVTADVINSTTSFADITGLTCPLLAGKQYNWLAHLIHANNASTTGTQWAYNIGAAPTSAIITEMSGVTVSVTAGTFSNGVATARDTASSVTTAGATGQRLAIVTGMIIPSANGTFALRVASEVAVANGVTVKAGSWMRIWEATG